VEPSCGLAGVKRHTARIDGRKSNAGSELHGQHHNVRGAPRSWQRVGSYGRRLAGRERGVRAQGRHRWRRTSHGRGAPSRGRGATAATWPDASEELKRRAGHGHEAAAPDWPWARSSEATGGEQQSPLAGRERRAVVQGRPRVGSGGAGPAVGEEPRSRAAARVRLAGPSAVGEQRSQAASGRRHSGAERRAAAPPRDDGDKIAVEMGRARRLRVSCQSGSMEERRRSSEKCRRRNED